MNTSEFLTSLGAMSPKERFLSTLRAFIGVQDEKKTAKDEFLGMSSSADGWREKRDAFRALDDSYEELGAALVTQINELRSSDVLEEVLAALTETEERLLHFFFDERGFSELLAATPKGLGELVMKYRKASAVFTAAQALNRLRASADDVVEWEEILDGESPRENLDAGWDKAVELLRAEFDALAETVDDADDEEIWREATFNVERKTRKALDAAGEQLVDFMRVLVETGRFDYEVSDLEPEVRRHARDLLRMVPQLETKTQTRPEPRPVAVLDRPETDTEPETDSWTDLN